MISYCPTCRGILGQLNLVTTPSTISSGSYITYSGSSTSLQFCTCPVPIHNMVRFILEFEELCDEDTIWYPVRQEGCISSEGAVFVFDYKLPLPANESEQEPRHERFSSYREMMRIYHRRSFLRNITERFIDISPLFLEK